MKKAVLFRVDGSERIGSGHVMRCFAMAQEWQRRGYIATFLMAESTALQRALIQGSGMEWESLDAAPGSDSDARETIKVAASRRTRFVILDSYAFDAKYQMILYDTNLRTLLFDDYVHANAYYVDAILNQNLSATPGLYAGRAPHSRLLLGERYAQIRDEFLRIKNTRRTIAARAEKILVTLGAGINGPLETLLSNALELAAIPASSVRSAGGANPSHTMAELMAWADMAITAGGSTCLEAACMGLPSLVVVTAENQRPAASALAERRVVVFLGESYSAPDTAAQISKLRDDAGERERMSCSGQQLVDGNGSKRVVDFMCGLGVRLRAAEFRDCELLWRWVNDESVRLASFDSEHIPFEAHQSWFTARLSDPRCKILIATDEEDVAVGQVRFEWQDRAAHIDVSVAPEQRGKGFASRILQDAVVNIFETTEVTSVSAFIKPSNGSSIRSFEKAAFRRHVADKNDSDRVHLMIRKEDVGSH